MMMIQCLAATMFLFFACLAPAIGFGGLFGLATGNAIGTVEMISSTAASGVIYALVSAQPLTIIGGYRTQKKAANGSSVSAADLYVSAFS
jgi:uncharacterized membrane protein (Fun14 family)